LNEFKRWCKRVYWVL